MQPTQRAWVEINIQELKQNILTLKKFIPAQTAFALVVKGNAYGHDQALITRYCEQENIVDYFCVAYATEGLSLRKKGITKPILIMCAIDTNISELILHDIDITISDIPTLITVNQEAKKLKKNASVHIKIDTGLSRFGFLPSETQDAIPAIHACTYITVRGIYSHFAQSSNTDRAFTQKQQALFETIVTQLLHAGIKPQYIHQQNSAATITQPHQLYNMVRVGALAYGMWSSTYEKEMFHAQDNTADIAPILSLKASITALKTIPSGSQVGYNGIFVTTRPTTIAILPIGYADGYLRMLGASTQTSYVYIHNRYAPIIGHVAMNALTIDVTDIPEAQLGDPVLLIGDYPKLRANDLALILGSGNPREVTVHINSTLPRILV